MRRVLEISGAEILPSANAILEQQGVPGETTGQERLLDISAEGRSELATHLTGRGVFAPIPIHDFAVVYEGIGRNNPRTPLEEIFPRAEALILFAVTCGEAVTGRIAELFAAGEYPLAMALDAAASLAADQAAQWLQDRVGEPATGDSETAASLRYSPGYCGWHVSGQQTLFAALRPEAIGLRLTDSFLMDPLKSVSGVIVTGKPAIHQFDHDFDFCAACTDKECRQRIDSLDFRTG